MSNEPTDGDDGLVERLIEAADDENNFAQAQDFWHEEILRKAAVRISELARDLLAAEQQAMEQRDRIAVLEAENADLRKLASPEWFYLAGDMSSDRCRFSPDEVVDEDWLFDNKGEGSVVIQIETATSCPDIWAAVRFFSEAEKDARGSDDDYELTEHASEEEARTALAKGEG